MADQTVRSPFPTMGEHGIPDSFMNMSGERSPYTKAVPKGGAKGAPDLGVAGVRGSTVIHEANGPTLKPVTTICYPSNPEASDTPRSMRILPARTGNFLNARALAGGTEGV